MDTEKINAALNDQPEDTISASALDVYLSCPRKYHYRYTAGIEEPEEEEENPLRWLSAADKGILIHKTMELYVQQNIIVPYSCRLATEEAPAGSDEEKRILTALDELRFSEEAFTGAWETAVRLIEEIIQKRSFELLEIPLSAKEKELEDNKKECREALISLIEKMKERKQYPVFTEMKFGKSRRDRSGESSQLLIEKEGKKGFGINGSIDRVDYDVRKKVYVVVDYKTGKIENKKKLRKGERDDLLQDRLYALAFEKMNPGKNVVTSRYVFTASDNEEIIAMLDKESKKKFEERLWNEMDGIREKKDVACKDHTEDYPDHEETCRYCAYAELCRAYSELKGVSD